MVRRKFWISADGQWAWNCVPVENLGKSELMGADLWGSASRSVQGSE